LLVQPSRTEGFGNTIVEAMAAKVPVLISNLSGPMEIIQNGRYGYSFSSNNHVECAERISNIVQDYNIGNVEKLVDMAYSYAFENFDISRSAKKMFSIYKESILQR
jgi:glycosyltransferase involved in cell wall biosynthesis